MLYFAHAPLTLVASASFSTAMICSSLNRLLFIGSAPDYRAELYFWLVHFFGIRPHCGQTYRSRWLVTLLVRIPIRARLSLAFYRCAWSRLPWLHWWG